MAESKISVSESESDDDDENICSENENDLFEEDVKSLTNILNLNQKFIHIKEIMCSAGSSSGDNYMSIVKRVIVIGIDDKNEESAIPLIIKRQIPSLSRRQLYRCDEAFNNEINAYVHIVPIFEQIVGQQSSFPKCHFAGADENGELIILEDLKHSGFQMGNRFCGLDFDHCKLVMEELAKLHATSIYIQHIDNQLFNEKLQNLKEIVYCSEAEEFYRAVLVASIREALASLKSSNKNDDSLTEPIRLIENLEAKLFNIISNCIRSSQSPLKLSTESTSSSSSSSLSKESITAATATTKTFENSAKVICHGDMWINNIMFKRNHLTGKPYEVKFVDLQAMRYALPVFDILHFIYTSTKRDLRDAYLEQLLEIYSTSLLSNLLMNFNSQPQTKQQQQQQQFNHKNNYCNCSSSNSSSSSSNTYNHSNNDNNLKALMEVFSKQNINKLFYSNILYGLAVCMWITPAVTFDPNNIPNLDNINEIESLDEQLNMAQKLTPEYHSRMKDIALEFYENGFLKLG